MKADYIKVKEINFVSITKCNMKKTINEHGFIEIEGIIKDKEEDNCISLAERQSYIHVVAKKISGESKIIFCGYIDEMEIDCDMVKIIKIKLVTGTKQLDLSVRTRTFQNIGMSYEEIIRSNDRQNTNIKAGSKFLESGANSIGKLIVQFQETDWEFAKRMASRNQTFIRPSFQDEGCKYFWGLNKENKKTHEKPSSFFAYKVKKRNTEFQKINKRNPDSKLSEKDSYSYFFSSRNILEVGDCVLLNGKTLYVYANHGYFEGEELINHYELRTADGFKQITKYNKKIIGASLSGNVVHADRDQIDMNLNVDAQYSDHGIKMFPYSTVYSSPDGTGWYCMPEPGDEIRLYFPSDREEEAYAISSVHLEVSTISINNDVSSTNVGTAGNAERQDPNNKKFSNPAGKFIEFKPNSIEINNPAVGYIKLTDDEGIEIHSDKSIQFKAQNFIEVHSTTSEITMNAATDITFEQGENTKFKLNKNVYMSGGKFKLQEK